MTLRPIALQKMVRGPRCPLDAALAGNKSNGLSAESEEPTIPMSLLIGLEELAVFSPVGLNDGDRLSVHVVSLYDIKVSLCSSPYKYNHLLILAHFVLAVRLGKGNSRDKCQRAVQAHYFTPSCTPEGSQCDRRPTFPRAGRDDLIGMLTTPCKNPQPPKPSASTLVKSFPSKIKAERQDMTISKSDADCSMDERFDLSKSAEPIRVLLVDDHAMVRQALRSYLSTYYSDIEVVGEAGSGEEALQAVQMLSPSVVVMDINMPGLNGIEATARIKVTHPRVRIVGLSMSVDEDYQYAMIAAGASALISKGAVVERLYDAITHCLVPPNENAVPIKRATELGSSDGTIEYT